MSDWYIERQLQNFRKGIRGSHPQDFNGAQMASMARVVADDQAIVRLARLRAYAVSARTERAASLSRGFVTRVQLEPSLLRMSMSFVAIADRDHEHALHDPQTFIRKYIWSQDHKVIAIQYAIVAIVDRAGRAGACRC